ncbi:nucleoside phosphorylase [Lewinella cohaerens]|uniref:nucleoside phosphorylase n=1 Tax=Lewinella cohaerens TaxID=70995 RepID=UPI0003707660|nr:nucleoside phosphorylase [Lewinella cohaerens]
MKDFLPPSELIVNPDGSIYHLNLRPEDVGDYIITVGDQNRVARVSQHFDEVTVRKEKREFVTHTGRLGNKRITVISTGIGPDNIDIVLNELDALVNIDFEARKEKAVKKKLAIIRIGTTGGLQPENDVDDIICSSAAMGFDNLMSFYEWQPSSVEQQLEKDWHQFLEKQHYNSPILPYFVEGSQKLLDHIGADYAQGITITAPGFYGPQGRTLRATTKLSPAIFDHLHDFRFGSQKITNLEMETSALYGLSRILGHDALSCSVILANRSKNTFSANPKAAVDNLITEVLKRIAELE